MMKTELDDSDSIHCFFRWGIYQQALAGPYFGPTGTRSRVMHRRAALAMQALTEVQAHLHGVMDKKAAAFSARFPLDSGGLRFFVYQQLVNAGGGLNEAVRDCPGLFLLAFEMRRQRLKQASKHIIGLLRHGHPVDLVVTTAVEHWARRAATPTNIDLRPAQRIRVRHAGPRVSPHTLWHGCLPDINVQEIPTRPRDNSRWFEIAAEIAWLHWAATDLASVDRSALLAFCRRNVGAMVALIYKAPDAAYLRSKGLLALLLAYASQTGDIPSRRMPFSSFLARARRWLSEDHPRRYKMIYDLASGDSGTGIELP